MHQIAPFCKIFSEELAPKHLCNAQHAVSRHAYIYTSGKIICMPLLNPVMYAHLSLFGNEMTIKKGPLQFIKITLHWLYQLFCKNTTFTVFVRFLKKNS